MDRIVLAFATEEAHAQLTRLLGSGGLVPPSAASAAAEAIRAARKLGERRGDLRLPSAGHDRGAAGRGPAGIAPVLVVSSPGNLELCGEENLFKLAVPATRAEFFASLDLLCRRDGAAPPAHPQPQRSEEEERLIRRAKALLMEVNLMSEAEAHRFLQKRSMDAGAEAGGHRPADPGAVYRLRTERRRRTREVVSDEGTEPEHTPDL